MQADLYCCEATSPQEAQNMIALLFDSTLGFAVVKEGLCTVCGSRRQVKSANVGDGRCKVGHVSGRSQASSAHAL